MVLFEILEVRVLVLLRRQFLLQKSFVLSNTARYWYLSNCYSLLFSLVHSLYNKTAPIYSLNLPSKPFPADRNISLFSFNSIFHHRNHIINLMRLNRSAPPRSNSLRPVDEYHRKNGQIVVRLNVLTLFVLVLYHVVVLFLENISGQRVQFSKNVSRRSVVFSLFVSRTKLTQRFKDIEVIRTNKILSHRYDSPTQRHLPMVVS